MRGWAAGLGFDYRFLGDELFEPLSEDLRSKLTGRTVIAADIGRLHALQHALDEGYETAVWLDADVVVVDAAQLRLGVESYALGREVWVQADPAQPKQAPRVRVHVHNAALMFRRGNPFLSFYLHAAERIVRLHQGHMVDQVVGPKLLTALHNLVRAPVLEQVHMASPEVVRDLAAGSGPCLDELLARAAEPPAAFNLCASMVARGRLTDAEVNAALDALIGYSPTLT